MVINYGVNFPSSPTALVYKVNEFQLSYSGTQTQTEISNSQNSRVNRLPYTRVYFASHSDGKPPKSYVVFLSPNLGFPLGVYFTKTTVFGPFIRYLCFLRSSFEKRTLGTGRFVK